MNEGWWVVRVDTGEYIEYTVCQGAERPDSGHNDAVEGPFPNEAEAQYEAALWYLADKDAEEALPI
jgi:hypothetical protein